MDPTPILSCTTAGEVSISVVESPTPCHVDAVQFLVPTKISMDSSNHTASGTPGEIAIPIIDTDADEEYSPPFLAPHVEQFHNHQGILHLLYAGAIAVMYPSLAQLAQLKFQNNIPSPFETHSVFAYMAVVAYIIAIPTSLILFSIPYLEGITKERFSPSNYTYMILKSTFCFSGILAPLSLVLMMLVPNGFKWIGYLVVFALFVIIVAFNFDDCIKLRAKKDISNSRVVQRDDTSPHSIVTICD